jgi:hypothetical protein
MMNKDWYEEMKALPLSKPVEHMNIAERGVKVGRELERMEEKKRWEVLADFWTEMLICLAPSDKVKEHCAHLAKGGEFITHLWALLSHAGIFDREHDQVKRQEGSVVV